MARYTDRDATYHKWGGYAPALATFRYRSPHAHLVGKWVTLTGRGGKRGKVMQATPRGLVVRLTDGTTLHGVAAADVATEGEKD